MVFAFAGDSTTTSAFAIDLSESPYFHPSTICQIRTNRPPPARRTRPLQFELEQPRQQPRRLQPRSLGNRVEIARVRPAAGTPAPGRRARCTRWRRRCPDGTPPARSQLFQDIVRGLHNLCTVPQERVAAAVAAVEDVAGTASTSRPCSSAQRAVMSDPLFSPASMTTTARDRPLMMRLRSGKKCGSGGVPGHELAHDARRVAASRARAPRARADR